MGVLCCKTLGLDALRKGPSDRLGDGRPGWLVAWKGYASRGCDPCCREGRRPAARGPDETGAPGRGPEEGVRHPDPGVERLARTLRNETRGWEAPHPRPWFEQRHLRQRGAGSGRRVEGRGEPGCGARGVRGRDRWEHRRER